MKLPHPACPHNIFLVHDPDNEGIFILIPIDPNGARGDPQYFFFFKIKTTHNAFITKK
jgi:hypothetical protein